MPSSRDREILTAAFERDVLWPSGEPRLEDAWLAIYQLLSWYAHGHLHIREANDLLKPAWQARAVRAEAYVADALAVKPQDLAAHVDIMMQLDRWRVPLAEKGAAVTCPHCGNDFVMPSPRQRNNSLGNGLRILIAYVLRRWGNPDLVYEEEARTSATFPGIAMPGRSRRAMVDVLAKRDGRPRAIISCKWSIRHDRMADVTNECPQYKAAAMELAHIMNLGYYVITTELDGQRINKMLEQPCMDGLALVHLPLTETVGTVTDRMRSEIAGGRLLDLTELVKLTRSW